MYGALLSILYAWSVFQAYSYDAKTQNTGIFIYILVYGGFTLLIRSFADVIMMNLLSAITLPFIFSVPVTYHAGAYFDFQPYIGIIATIIIGVIQGGLFVPLNIWGQKFLTSKLQYALSAVVAIAFTIELTISISMVHTIHWPAY